MTAPPIPSGQVIWHVTMSLDGSITGPDHAMDWAFGYEASPLAQEVMDRTGAILAGRRWYDVASERYDGVAGIYGGAWTGPVFVLTHRPDEVEDDSVTFVSGGVSAALEAARAAAGREKNVEIFGAETARQCLEAGQVDEIVIHLAPVLLGDGVRLYGGGGAGPVELEPIAVAGSGGLTHLRFRVPR